MEVWFSRWIAMESDGTPIEDRGVMPDIKVAHDPDQDADPTYLKAVEMLKKQEVTSDTLDRADSAPF